jgi:competence protein ComEC
LRGAYVAKRKMKKIIFVVTVLFFLLGCILTYQNIIYNDKKLHVVICDVGQGDAIFIRTPNGSDILIDGGPDNSVLACLGKHMPFWDKTIEIMISTHPHLDHLAGLIDVTKRYRALAFGNEKIDNPTETYKELIKQLSETQTKERFLYQEDRFIIKDGVVLKTLWPTHEWADQNSKGEGADENGLSVIELLSYENFSALFTGDAQASDLEKIDLMEVKIDLLKVPHHGSKTGLDLEVLDILDPKIAAISVGKNNKYGHPTPFILDLLKSLNIKTLRTDQVGDIEIISDGEKWKVN